MQNPASENAQARLVEHYLALEWAMSSRELPLTITRTALMDEFGFSADTYRRILAALEDSGRWQIVRGSGSTSTTFMPTFPASAFGGAE